MAGSGLRPLPGMERHDARGDLRPALPLTYAQTYTTTEVHLPDTPLSRRGDPRSRSRSRWILGPAVLQHGPEAAAHPRAAEPPGHRGCSHGDPDAPAHRLVVGTPLLPRRTPCLRDVEVTVVDAEGRVRAARRPVWSSFGRCGEVGMWTGADARCRRDGQTTVRLTSRTIHLDRREWRRSPRVEPGLVLPHHRPTQLIAGRQVELGESRGRGALEFAMSETPGYECPGHSKW